MPRIRAIKPDFFKSVALSGLPLTARVTFAGLWCYCDDEGRAVDDARLVKAEVWPLDDSVSVKKVDATLDALADAWHIHRYTFEGRRYLHVVNWLEHQRINRPTPSRLPACPTCEEVREVQPPRPSDGTKKKVTIPQSVRREVALRAGGQPGTDKKTSCHYCDAPGIIVWSAKKTDGTPRAWVHFDGLELDHAIPEANGGPTTAENIVLACGSCNRTKGHRSDAHAFLREHHGVITEESGLLTVGKEGKGRERKGKEGNKTSLPTLPKREPVDNQAEGGRILRAIETKTGARVWGSVEEQALEIAAKYPEAHWQYLMDEASKALQPPKLVQWLSSQLEQGIVSRDARYALDTEERMLATWEANDETDRADKSRERITALRSIIDAEPPRSPSEASNVSSCPETQEEAG